MFRNRRVLGTLLIALGGALLLLAAIGRHAPVVHRGSDALLGAVLLAEGVSAWWAGVAIDGRGVRVRGVFLNSVGHARSYPWQRIDGFDAPEARLDARPDRGYVELHLASDGSVRLPRVRESEGLVETLTARLGPQRPR